MQTKSLLLVGFAAFAAACGGGKPITPDEEVPGGVITVHASAGAPLEGVRAVAYAIDPVTGKPIEGRTGGAVLAEAAGSDAAGKLELKLGEDVTWRGPIQVVVTGDDIRYVDPTGNEDETLVSLPDSFRLTSFVPQYSSGSNVAVPVTLWTSLADAAAFAYAAGRTSDSVSAVPMERALPIIDALFSGHLSRPQVWDLRRTVPVDGRGKVGSVRDVVFAALADIGLNQLARDISITAGHEPGAVITAYQLLELLQADISDGVFNGLEGEKQLAARGGVYTLSSRTTRFDLARALGAFVDAPVNATGLSRQSLESYSVFDNIALDRNFLYPTDEDPEDFDALPPEVELLEALPEYVSEELLTVRVRASDNSVGVARVRAVVQSSGEEVFEAVPVDDHWEFVFRLKAGSNSIEVWADDEAVPVNSGRGWSPPHSILATIVRDSGHPSVAPLSAPSHRNEDGAALVLSGGKPVVPGKLALEGRSREDLGSSGTIRKTYVTSSWRDEPPTGEELEGENPRNIPFRQFSVSFAGGELEAPLAAVTWRFEASDDNWSTVKTSEGEAIPAAKEAAGQRLFDVVFSQETIPLLRTTTARSVALKLFFTAADAAGNATEVGPFEHSYEFVDTPLYFKVDESYPAQGSSKSLYGYFTNRRLYPNLFSPTNPHIRLAGAARVGRIEVLNPWPVPFAVRQLGSPYFSFFETWTNHLEPYAEEVISMDGMSFNRVENWPAARGSGSEFSCLLEIDSVCGVGWQSVSHVRHDATSNSHLVCGAGTTPPKRAFSAIEKLTHSSARYVLTEAFGADVMAETLGEGGSAVVPAAGFEAGRIVIFPGLRGEAFARDWRAEWDTRANQWDHFGGIFYADKGRGAFCSNELGGREQTVRYEAQKWHQWLVTATSRYAGPPLEFQGRPIYTEATMLTEVGPVPAPALVPFSVEFTHVQ